MSTGPNEPICLTDLPDDCLREILERISLSDLTSVSATNKKLNEVAREVFARKYGRRLIEMTSSCISAWNNNGQRIGCTPHYRRTPDWQTFFYYFGSFLTRLSIQFDDNLTLHQIERIMFRRCTENLIELKMSGIRTADEFRTEEAEFPKVEKLSIYSCEIPQQKLYDILDWFPSVIDLDLVHSYTPDDGYDYAFLTPSNRNVQHYKCIESFKAFDPRDFDALFHNQNLRSLSIGFSREHIYSIPVSDWIFNAIGTQESALVALELYNMHARLNPPENGSLSLRKLKINGTIPVGELLATQFDHLEELELETSELAHGWMDFITKLPLLKKLSIRIFGARNYRWRSIKDLNFLKFAGAKKLEELTFAQRGEFISIDAVRRFLFRCGYLKRLTMVYYSKNDQKRHQFRHFDFGPTWKVREDFLAIVIEKK